MSAQIQPLTSEETEHISIKKNPCIRISPAEKALARGKREWVRERRGGFEVRVNGLGPSHGAENRVPIITNNVTWKTSPYSRTFSYWNFHCSRPAWSHASREITTVEIWAYFWTVIVSRWFGILAFVILTLYKLWSEIKVREREMNGDASEYDRVSYSRGWV